MKKKSISLSGLIDLAQPRLGSKILYKTDDFFGPVERILSSTKPIWKEGIYDKNGKWMDGWETRRKRSPGNDYLILYLGRPGKLNIINIDTSYFNGNHPKYASVEGCSNNKKNLGKNVTWKTILKKSRIKPNTENFFSIKKNETFTHIKLNIFPDGGVARLRLFGKISLNKSSFKNNKIELSSILNGTSIVAVNNEHFGKAENILAPGRAINMGDGWETRRRRDQGNDWVIFKFGIPGKIQKIIIDTLHFKGNYPDYFILQGKYINENKIISKNELVKKSNNWDNIVKKTKLYENKMHIIENILSKKIYNFIKLSIFPDGGISRVNIFGNKKK